jgi:hypothetical protein
VELSIYDVSATLEPRRGIASGFFLLFVGFGLLAASMLFLLAASMPPKAPTSASTADSAAIAPHSSSARRTSDAGHVSGTLITTPNPARSAGLKLFFGGLLVLALAGLLFWGFPTVHFSGPGNRGRFSGSVSGLPWQRSEAKTLVDTLDDLRHPPRRIL